MKVTSKTIAVATFTLLFTVMAVLQTAAQSSEFKGQGKQSYAQKDCKQGNRGERMASYLELTDQQTEQIEKLRLKHQKTVLPLRNELQEKKAKLQTLSTAETADMKAINALIDDMSAVKTKMMKEKASHRQEVRKLLTEEQRVKFDMHYHKRGKGKGHGHGHGHGHGSKCR